MRSFLICLVSFILAGLCSPSKAQAQSDLTEEYVIVEEWKPGIRLPQDVALTPRSCALDLPDWASDAERTVWGDICTQGWADVSVWAGDTCTTDDPDLAQLEPWALSEQFMTLILTDPKYIVARPTTGIGIHCAYIPYLEIADRRLPGSLTISDSTLQYADLTDTRIDGSLDMRRSTILERVHANRLRLNGPLRFNGVQVGDYPGQPGNAYFQDIEVKGFASFRGATISGQLELERGLFHKSLFLGNYGHFGDIDLADARIAIDLSLDDAITTGWLDLESIRIGNSLQMRAGVFHGYVDLVGANIGGNLAANRSTFNGKLRASHISAGGDIYLRDGAIFQNVDLIGTNIDGNLEADTSTFAGFLNAENLTLKGSLLLRNGASFKNVKLLLAKIGGSLEADRSTFTGRFNASNIAVGSDVYLRNRASFQKVELIGAQIAGQLQLQGGTFSDKIDLSEARIGSLLLWRYTNDDEPGARSNVTWKDDAALILRNTVTGSLQARMRPSSDGSRKDNWHLAGGSRLPVDLNGFAYQKLGGFTSGVDNDLARVDAPSLIAWISESPTPGMTGSDGYRPQPYRALETALSDMGAEAAAREVAYARLKHRTATRISTDIGTDFWTWLWQVATYLYDRFLQFTVGFGVYPARAFYWFVGLVVVGAVIARNSGELCTRGRLDCFWYSLENAIPLMEASEDHKIAHSQSWVRNFFHFQKVSGFLLASVLIGALTLGG